MVLPPMQTLPPLLRSSSATRLTSSTKPNLDRAFRLILGGATLVGMHRNPWWYHPAGPTLDAGVFLVGLEWASGRRARTVGKPSPAFFRSGFERLASEAAARGEPPLLRSQVVMVGDDVSSDIGGGRRAACGRCSSGPGSTVTRSWWPPQAGRAAPTRPTACPSRRSSRRSLNRRAMRRDGVPAVPSER